MGMGFILKIVHSKKINDFIDRHSEKIGCLFWILIIVVLFLFNSGKETEQAPIQTPKEVYIPDKVAVSSDLLDELKELAEDRSRNYGEILDDIENKVAEIEDDKEDVYEYIEYLEKNNNYYEEDEHAEDRYF